MTEALVGHYKTESDRRACTAPLTVILSGTKLSGYYGFLSSVPPVMSGPVYMQSCTFSASSNSESISQTHQEPSQADHQTPERIFFPEKFSVFDRNVNVVIVVVC